MWCEAECDATQLLTAADENDNERVVELYRGPFLEGVDSSATGVEIEEWIYTTREALGARARQALLNLAEDHARGGEFKLGAEKAQRAYLLSGAPEPEQGELERLFVLLTAGEHRMALEVQKEAVGYDVDLSLSVKDARAVLLKDGGTPGREARHNLPVQPTRFVGREEEKEKLAELFADPDCRLLTIAGPGGIGKTRLAIELARDQAESFPDGAFFVPFAPLTSPASMPNAITNALNVDMTGGTNAAEQLVSHLKTRNLLLVLDSLEHLLDGIDLVRGIWERAPWVKLLVTSRVRLNLRAEQVFTLAGLTSLDETAVEESDAVKLFLQTARNGGHELSESAMPTVVRICQLLGGMPLAIELAASWLKVLTPEEIVTEITRGIDVLQASARDVPERHKSIRAVFDSSWKLLTESEREVLRKLSVVRGGGGRRDAAGAVTGASLFTLGKLVDSSFLTLDSGGRYEQHPLVLEYARERLAEQPEEQAEVEERHGLYTLLIFLCHTL